MARHPRLVVPGVALHIVQRGVNRSACFRDDMDRLVYLSVLRSLLQKTACALHAYCLMTNHVHLLLTPPAEDACERMMRELGRRYVPYFNKRHCRTGTLWEGRYRSCLVDSPEYVLACHRYIERNPVRAAMVASPSAHPWSSYRANAGEAEDPTLVEHAEFTALGMDTPRRRAAYRAFCQAEDDADFLSAVRNAANGGLPLVDASFKAKLALHGRRVERGKPGPRRQPGGEDAAGAEPGLRLFQLRP